jgi:hypothetical protein
MFTFLDIHFLTPFTRHLIKALETVAYKENEHTTTKCYLWSPPYMSENDLHF